MCIRDRLGAPKGAADQVAANVGLWGAPTLPARALYAGVLYDALGFESLSAGARRRAARRLVVISALFGALRPADKVPAYRLSMDVRLPGVGGLAAHWRPELDAVLPATAGRGVIVDLRSSTYVAAWRPNGALAERTVSVHVVRDDAGRRPRQGTAPRREAADDQAGREHLLQSKLAACKPAGTRTLVCH